MSLLVMLHMRPEAFPKMGRIFLVREISAGMGDMNKAASSV